MVVESDERIEVGAADEALGWIEDSGLGRRDRRRLEALVHRFPEQRFYRERDAGLDWVERATGVKLPGWYRRMRQALAFVAPGSLEAVRLSGQEARRPLHEQDCWYAFDLLGVPAVESCGGAAPQLGKMLALGRNLEANWDWLTISQGRGGKDPQAIKLVYPDARRLELPRGTRTIFDDYLTLIDSVRELRLVDDRRVRRLPARPMGSRLEMLLTIELEDRAPLELFCIEHDAHLRLEPDGRFRGWLDYQAQLLDDFTGERFGTLEVSGRIGDRELAGRIRTPMNRRRRDAIEIDGFDEAGDGVYRCELGADVGLHRSRARLRFDGQLELWIADGAGRSSAAGSGLLADRVVEQLEALGGWLEGDRREVSGEGDLDGALSDVLDRMRFPAGARYINFGLTMPQVRMLRFLAPEERQLLAADAARLACNQGERPLAVIGEDRETDRLVLLACDGRHPADPLLYLVVRDNPAQKLGHGVPLSSFLRSLAPRRDI